MKKKCKALCIYCSNHFTDDGEHKCNAYLDKVTTCVTGETKNFATKCELHNKDGGCSKYKEDEMLVARDKLIAELNSYMSTKTHGLFSSYASVENSLLSDLREVLLGGDSYYMQSTWRQNDDGCYPEGNTIIPTKSFFEAGKKYKKVILK